MFYFLRLPALAFLLATASLLASSSSHAQDGSQTTRKTFSRATTCSIQIDASTAEVWAILTNGEKFASWNSTIVSFDGTIALKEKVKLVSTLDPDRTFKLKVKKFEANKLLVWDDAMGTRTHTLVEKDGGTYFTMHEIISSPMFPLFAKAIPAFDGAFNSFTADLKAEAEK